MDKQNRPKVSRASLWLELGTKIRGISLWNPRFFLGIIQRTAVDSVFGESGPISTGGLKKGNIQSHDFMFKSLERF